MPPEISVLMPCRNVEGTVATALGSLSGQTWDDFEVVAVDDGSTDGTPDELTRWAARDRRIRVITTDPRGIVSALQRGANACRGTLLARMDADDRAAPTRLAAQHAFLRDRPDLDACGTGIRYFPRRHVRAGARRYESWINAVVTSDAIDRNIFVECPLPHPTLMIRRRALDAVGGYRDVPWPEDYDLILRLWTAGHRLGKVPAVLHDWRESPFRLSRTDPRYHPTAFRRCKVHYLARRLHGRPVMVWGAGPLGKAFAHSLAAEGHEVRAFIDFDPRKVGQRVGSIPIIGPEQVSPSGPYVVAAVGAAGARDQILDALGASGFDIPRDACAVA